MGWENPGAAKNRQGEGDHYSLHTIVDCEMFIGLCQWKLKLSNEPNFLYAKNREFAPKKGDLVLVKRRMGDWRVSMVLIVPDYWKDRLKDHPKWITRIGGIEIQNALVTHIAGSIPQLSSIASVRDLR